MPQTSVLPKTSGQMDRMQKAVFMVYFLVVGWSSTLQGVPVLPDPVYPTQENFDLARVSSANLPVLIFNSYFESDEVKVLIWPLFHPFLSVGLLTFTEY